MAWQRLCSAEEVPSGRLIGVEIQGVKVLLTRIDQKFVAFPPLCPHMAEPLEVSGICAEGILTCTKHIWQWDLKTGAPVGEAEKPLLHYTVKLDGDALWIEFEGELTYDYDE